MVTDTGTYRCYRRLCIGIPEFPTPSSSMGTWCWIGIVLSWTLASLGSADFLANSWFDR
jgi:hypothetical protein